MQNTKTREDWHYFDYFSQLYLIKKREINNIIFVRVINKRDKWHIYEKITNNLIKIKLIIF